ncbi:hypothetical protein AKJ47_01155 [candidate division MSBL1 archaeon SCGC-AAA261G05]|uniref:Exonuclease domain-containing protein n=3 Tax=candidate division MSBL1 TaxID=215777 RepID=A0A133V0B3_9EURY|nr:hypothetical protein AKJ42_02330 [candidate division MSBL1 archaeon SCGC-AAA261C02]KXB03021.1 hypothetical protein AKJ48_04310 [candidate division MSBL1 archaeon SCGC-AAA261O19]KXB03989.1 hypothetical protein AKJ47_01155 [candidate division MSBL1 archaeon SCGC-AAA261G05]
MPPKKILLSTTKMLSCFFPIKMDPSSIPERYQVLDIETTALEPEAGLITAIGHGLPPLDTVFLVARLMSSAAPVKLIYSDGWARD